MAKRKGSETKVKGEDLDEDVDALFRLPLAEFTGARNVLSTRQKKRGMVDDAAQVQALAKPSISAWAVNQLYWNHREAFDRLIASADRFYKAQKSGKVAEMRQALDARRESLTQLSDLATSLLRAAGNNPSSDTIHRITTTLEGISAYTSRSDAPQPGRLTHDVDPPGFESFASFAGSGVQSMRLVTPALAAGSTSAKRKQAYPPTKTRRKEAESSDTRQKLEARKAKIAAAKSSLQEANRSLTKLRARAESLTAAQKKADEDAKTAEKLKREAELSLQKAKFALEVASRRARSVAEEVEKAESAVGDAELTFEKASKELEALSQK